MYAAWPVHARCAGWWPVACPSSNDLGHVILFSMGGSGSSRFDFMPLVVDGSSGGFGWSVS